MPLLFGCILGFFVFAHLWAFIGPFVALLNFIMGRFFVASVIMTISLWSATFILDDLHVGRDEYKVLLFLGLLLEGVKWAIKQWWLRRRQPELDTTQAEFGSNQPEYTIDLTQAGDIDLFKILGSQELKGLDVTVSVVDKQPRRKTRRKIELRKNARGVYSPDGS
jgi:hypothetical protein